MFWCILLTQRTSTALPMPWSLHLFIALQLSSFPQHCNHSTKNHVSVFWSISWGQQGGQLGGQWVKSASKCKTKCHCRNICKKGRPGVRPGVRPGGTPGGTPGKKIHKICKKSSQKRLQKNMLGKMPPGCMEATPPTLKNGVSSTRNHCFQKWPRARKSREIDRKAA